MNHQIIERKKKYQNSRQEQIQKEKRIERARSLVFLLFIINILIFYNTKISIFKFLFFTLILLFFLLVFIHNNTKKEKERIRHYLEIIEKYEKRNTEQWQEENFETTEQSEDFLYDLDILGKNSLFQYLDFTVSLGGKRKLQETLTLKNIKYEQIKQNQQAIKELKDKFEFTLYFEEELLNIEQIKKTDFKEYLNLFDTQKKYTKNFLKVSIILSFITTLFLLLTCFSILTPIYFTAFALIQIIISYISIYKYKEQFDKIAKCSRKFSKLKNIYKFIENTQFTSAKNKRLQEQIINGKMVLNKLIHIANLDSFRLNFLSYIIGNIFFALNPIILNNYNKLIEKENKNFKISIDALEEIETLVSLTTIAYIKKEICLPKIDKELSLNIENMKHPLLQEKKCISNSFNSNKDINIITGSNMSGKTSFMRTIGINLVLAYIGTFVNAKEFTCPIMKIFTSINVKDDIKKGISTFYGELKRIKNILDYNKEKEIPLIIFIDEIFKGTNYNDRIFGAKEVLKKLASLNCIVFLTTHDFELCEIKEKKINNYHFEEFYKENKIYFDYKIKQGKCNTTNAKYLMRKMKIID
ncbi:MAG: hypothetical protein HFJ38_04620 [Bacilli bacterium]|nr:hypothetical protein [Bacilli bacterium]